MPVHIHTVYQVQEMRMSKGELATDSFNRCCRQMASKQAGRESTRRRLFFKKN